MILKSPLCLINPSAAGQNSKCNFQKLYQFFAFQRLYFSTFILFITLFLTISTYNFAQVKIKERVEIQPQTSPAGKGITLSKLSQTLRVSVTFTPFSYPFGGHGDGHIYGEVKIIKVISMFNRPVLASSGQVQNGTINLSAEIEVPASGAAVSIEVEGRFGTTLGHTASGFNVGNANVRVELYLNGKLQPENHTASKYSNFGFSIQVSKPECGEDAPQCDSPIKVPNFASSWYPDGLYGIITCESPKPNEPVMTAGFSPLNNFEDYNLIVCYNAQLDRWQFRVEGDTLSVKAILDLCLDNIQLKGWRLIDNVTDITADYGDTNPCGAKEDFEGHKVYEPQIKENGYVIKDVLLAHEHQHRRHFESFFDTFKPELQLKLDSYLKSCPEMDYEDAQSIGVGNIKKIYLDFLDFVNSKYKEEAGGSNEDQNEQDIHNSGYVQFTIEYYIGLLESIYGC